MWKNKFNINLAVQMHWLDVHYYNELLFVSLQLTLANSISFVLNTKDMVNDHSTFNFAYVDDTYVLVLVSVW